MRSEVGKSNPTNSKGGTNHTTNKCPRKTQYQTSDNSATVNFTGISTDVVLPLHRYQTQRKLIEAANRIDTVTLDAVFYPRKQISNYVAHPETGFALEYRHLVKGDRKVVCHISFSNKLGRISQGVVNIVSGSKIFFFVPKSQVPQQQKVTYGRIVYDIKP